MQGAGVSWLVPLRYLFKGRREVRVLAIRPVTKQDMKDVSLSILIESCEPLLEMNFRRRSRYGRQI